MWILDLLMPSFLPERKAKWLWRAGAHAVAHKKGRASPAFLIGFS